MSILSVNAIQPTSGNNIVISGDLTITGNIVGTISGSITNANVNVDGTVTNL
jgi:hypothetical protein